MLHFLLTKNFVQSWEEEYQDSKSIRKVYSDVIYRHDIKYIRYISYDIYISRMYRNQLINQSLPFFAALHHYQLKIYIIN